MFKIAPNKVIGRSVAMGLGQGQASSLNAPRMSRRWKRAWSSGWSGDAGTTSTVEHKVKRDEDRGKGGGRRK